MAKSSRYSDWLRAGRSRDRIPVGGEIFRTCTDRPWGPPSLLYNGYRVFPGTKERPGRDADLSPPSSAEVKERVELYLYSPYGPYGLYREPQCLYKGALFLFLFLPPPPKGTLTLHILYLHCFRFGTCFCFDYPEGTELQSKHIARVTVELPHDEQQLCWCCRQHNGIPKI